MLSNLILTEQKVVLIIDHLNRERIAFNFILSLLHEQGEGEEEVRALPIGKQLKHVATFEALLSECNSPCSTSQSDSDTKITYNVILPTLADLLCYQSPAYIFNFLNQLRRSDNVRRVFLWASPQYLQHSDADYILAGCEYMAELVVRLETSETLSLISRKAGGGVTNDRYACQVNKTEFYVTPLTDASESNVSIAASAANQTTQGDDKKLSDPGGTFKIELNEDEVIARNTLTLPYERVKEKEEGNIIYTPDADDDIDDEDPDEDLCI